MYFVGINAGAQVAIILLACGPCMVIINCWDRFCTLGRAPCTKETLLDFHEWCLVTRHPRVFCGLTGCQRTPGNGASQHVHAKIAGFHRKSWDFTENPKGGVLGETKKGWG